MLLDLKGNLKKAAEDSSRKNEAEFNHSCCEVKLYIEGPSKKSRQPMYSSVLEGHTQVLACINSLTSEGQNGAHTEVHAEEAQVEVKPKVHFEVKVEVTKTHHDHIRLKWFRLNSRRARNDQSSQGEYVFDLNDDVFTMKSKRSAKKVHNNSLKSSYSQSSESALLKKLKGSNLLSSFIAFIK